MEILHRFCYFHRNSQARQIKRTFNMRMADYRLFGKLHFKHDEEKLTFEIAHLNAANEKEP